MYYFMLFATLKYFLLLLSQRELVCFKQEHPMDDVTNVKHHLHDTICNIRFVRFVVRFI